MRSPSLAILPSLIRVRLQKMPRSYRVPLALAVGALIGASITLTQGVLADKATKPTAETLNFKDLQTFVEILNRVKSDYVEPVEDKTLIENAVRGMLAGLDPHSAYLDEDERSEERRVGNECVGTCRYRGWPDH